MSPIFLAPNLLHNTCNEEFARRQSSTFVSDDEHWLILSFDMGLSPHVLCLGRLRARPARKSGKRGLSFRNKQIMIHTNTDNDGIVAVQKPITILLQVSGISRRAGKTTKENKLAHKKNWKKIITCEGLECEPW
jgi:hypothetical protein